MANPASDDRPPNTLDLVIDILKKHSESLDQVTGRLEDILDAVSSKRSEKLMERIDSISQKVDRLEKDIMTLSRYYTARR